MSTGKINLSRKFINNCHFLPPAICERQFWRWVWWAQCDYVWQMWIVPYYPISIMSIEKLGKSIFLWNFRTQVGGSVARGICHQFHRGQYFTRGFFPRLSSVLKLWNRFLSFLMFSFGTFLCSALLVYTKFTRWYLNQLESICQSLLSRVNLSQQY